MKKKKDRIVFLDAGTVDWGDVSLAGFENFGDFKAYHDTASSEIEKRIHGAKIVITNKYAFDRARLSRFKTVRLIAVAATGVNNIDLDAARDYKIAVTNVSGYSTESVVQSTFAFILALAGNLVKYNRDAQDGRWSRSPFFTLGLYPIREIAGKTLGIIGYGTIGRRVARVANAFGMRVLAARIPGRNYPTSDRIKRVPFETVIRTADFVTVHTPLTELTRGLINARIIRKMKQGAFLINMARGGIIDEKALRRALESGHLGGAACDLLTAEPPPRNHVLLGAPNLLVTPHIAWASREARQRLVHEIALNIKAFQDGRRRNLVV